MDILELAIIKKMAGGGGGSGTDNYNDLSNLPQINGETLAGNKTSETLGLQDALTFDSAPTEDSTNPVESGGVYTALAGKQDNLTFDDDPTENSTNPVKSGGVYSGLAGKQDTLTFDGVYNASTNKAATESTVTNAINGLDVSAISLDADETISSISENDGKISVTKRDIAIASNQVTAMTGYSKPSSAPATPAIQPADTANAAIGKLEYKADVNQTNILYSLNTGVKNVLPVLFKSYSGSTITIKNNNDGSFTINGSRSESQATILIQNIQSDIFTSVFSDTTYKLKKNTDYVCLGTQKSDIAIQVLGWNTASDYEILASASTSDITFNTGTWEYIEVRVWVGAVASFSNFTFKPMICTEDAWNQSHEWQPYAKSNSDLTQIEAEDRASLVEVVDSGAKNIADFKSTTNCTVNSNGFTISVSGQPSSSTTQWIWEGKVTKSGYYTFAVKGTSIPTTVLYNATDDTNVLLYNTSSGGESSGYLTTGKTYKIGAYLNSSTTYSASFDCMLCTKAAFDISKAFVPYRLPYDVLDRQAPIVKFAQLTTGTDYQCISDVAFNIPKKSASTTAADRVYRITACACFSNSRPTGVIISRSNDPSNYTNSGQLVAKEERSADSTEGSLTKSVVFFNGSEVNNQNLYVWVKYNGSSVNRVYAVLEYLQN